MQQCETTVSELSGVTVVKQSDEYYLVPVTHKSVLELDCRCRSRVEFFVIVGCVMGDTYPTSD